MILLKRKIVPFYIPFYVADLTRDHMELILSKMYLLTKTTPYWCVVSSQASLERFRLGIAVVSRDKVTVENFDGHSIVTGYTRSGRFVSGVFRDVVNVHEHNSCKDPLEDDRRFQNMLAVRNARHDELPAWVLVGLEKDPTTSRFVNELCDS